MRDVAAESRPSKPECTRAAFPSASRQTTPIDRASTWRRRAPCAHWRTQGAGDARRRAGRTLAAPRDSAAPCVWRRRWTSRPDRGPDSIARATSSTSPRVPPARRVFHAVVPARHRVCAERCPAVERDCPQPDAPPPTRCWQTRSATRREWWQRACRCGPSPHRSRARYATVAAPNHAGTPQTVRVRAACAVRRCRPRPRAVACVVCCPPLMRGCTHAPRCRRSREAKD